MSTLALVADIGGTNARFALTDLSAPTVELHESKSLPNAEFASMQHAIEHYLDLVGAKPARAALAVACPVGKDEIRLTNRAWSFSRSELERRLGLDQLRMLNDFGAVAWAVPALQPDHLVTLHGNLYLPLQGPISVLGPGTGLGVAQLVGSQSHGWHAVETEGGHIGFAPQDEFDERLLANLRGLYGRVATERVNAGPGIAFIYAALGGRALTNDRVIWERGLAMEDPVAAQAVERFCASLGTTVGDYALAHGASAVVLAGGLGLKLRDVLPRSEFAKRFCEKPRYEAMMAEIPVKLIVHPQPGLYGAAAAFAAEHES